MFYRQREPVVDIELAPALSVADMGPVGGKISGAVVVVNDHWSSYFTIKLRDVQQVVCTGNHLRELQAMVVHDKEDWARWIQQLLRRANRAVRRARKRVIEIRQFLAALIERRFQQILEKAIQHHESLPLPSKALPWRISKACRKYYELIGAWS